MLNATEVSRNVPIAAIDLKLWYVPQAPLSISLERAR